MPAAGGPTRALDMGCNDIATTSPPLALNAHQGRAETQDQVTAPALDYGPIDLDLVPDSLADDSRLRDRALLVRGKLTAIHGNTNVSSIAGRSAGIAPLPDFERGHLAPERLEPVVVARARSEDVHDAVEVVHQDPASLGGALHALREHAAPV